MCSSAQSSRARARTVTDTGDKYIDLASARTTRCVTFAGAFDTYAKAVITGRNDYRAMCAPGAGLSTAVEAGLTPI